MCQCDRERFILERGEEGEVYCGTCGKLWGIISDTIHHTKVN